MNYEYPLTVAEQARDILAGAHAHILCYLVNTQVTVCKGGARSEVQALLLVPAPTLFRVGRFTFEAKDVLEMRHVADQWVLFIR
jgi:hypothetical protein